jgi:hypothetical protein
MGTKWVSDWAPGGAAGASDESSGLLGRGSSGVPSASSGLLGRLLRKGGGGEGGGSGGGGPSSSTPDDGRTSMLLTACNFMNGVVGAGIIGLPGALNEAGFSLGIALCLIVAVLSAWTIRLLAEVGAAHGVYTYQDLSQRAFGPAGYYLVCAFQGLFAFGAMCSYLVIFADTVPSVLREVTPWATTAPAALDRSAILVVGSLLILFPLCLLRQYAQLAKFSVLKFFAITFLTATVSGVGEGRGIVAPQPPFPPSPPLTTCALSLPPIQVIAFKYRLAEEVASAKSAEWKYEEVHANPFPALGTIAFAFVCHHQTFLAMGSLRNPTARRFAVTVNLAITGSFTVSILMGVFGYMTFWDKTKGDIFLNYEAFESVSSSSSGAGGLRELSPSKGEGWHNLAGRGSAHALTSPLPLPPSPSSQVRSSGVMNTARLFVALNMLITYPSEMMVARNTLEALLERRRKHRRWLALKAPVHDVVLLAQLRQQEELDALASADAWRCGQRPTRALAEHVGLTLGLYLLTLVIALTVRDLSRVLNITGSFTAVFLAFVLPAAIRLRLGAHPYDEAPLLSASNVPAAIVLAFGVIAFLASTGLSVVSAAS